MSKKNIKPVSSAVFCISVLLTFTLTEGYIDDSTWETFDASFYLFLIPALIAFFVCAAIIFRYQAIFENEKKLPKEE